MLMMKFEGPTIGVHHDIAPPPVRMTMSERFAARVAAQGGSKDVVDPSVNTAEDDRVAQMIRAINERTDRAAAAARDAELPPAVEHPPRLVSEREATVVPAEVAESPVEAAQEVVVEAAPEKTAEQIERDENAARAKILIRDAERRRAVIGTQRALVEARAALMKAPNVIPMAAKVERPPMPKIDQMQKIEIPGFGEGMVLSVDPDSDVIYFATPEERRRVDTMLMRDEGMSSMRAADFTKVIALTPEQARQYIAAANAKRRFVSAPENAPQQPAPANNPTHLANRYGMTG